jgi:hypothetical protein
MKRFNANAFRFTAAALFGATLSTAGVAGEYKCNQPPTRIDQLACDAAAQGPVALRRFIQRMQVIEPLSFSDYMTDAQLLAWREANEPTRTAKGDRAGTEGPKR